MLEMALSANRFGNIREGNGNMPDMLVKLYQLPDYEPEKKRMEASGVTVRRAIAPEKHVVVDWVRERFNAHWASECEAAFANHPVTCMIAQEGGKLIGFACYEATCKNFFGPTGVDPDYRGKGVGRALLIASLHQMAALGYGYAIIGGVGPADFYAKTVGAIMIEDSKPGIYKDMLR